jgi:uncharacterized protein YbaA (DUF1428 family)
MPYVDYIVSPIPKSKLAAYKKLARKSAKVWKKYGALSYCEAVADDVKPGKVTSFPQSLKLKKNEVAACSYVTYRSRAHRDQVWKKVMKDPFMANYDMKSAPFDAKRMFFGGFKSVVSF